MTKKLIRLSDVKFDGTLWNVADMLAAAIEQNEEEPADKAFVILLNDNDNTYVPRWLNCKLKMSEVITLLEVIKVDCLIGLRG
jgi:hypothetical protein